MAAPLSLGLGGNAITVSLRVWELMAAEGATIAAEPRALGEALRSVVRARERTQKPPLTFAMVYPFSSHNYELRYWLAASGIDPDRDVRLIVIPPPLLVDAMSEGQIDGFCVGEPWNSLAVAVGVGCIALPTTAIWRLSPEKVLGCRLEWTQRHPDRSAGPGARVASIGIVVRRPSESRGAVAAACRTSIRRRACRHLAAWTVQ